MENPEQLLSRYHLFTKALESFIRSLLNSHELKYHLLKGRTKKLERIKSKIEVKENVNAYKEITDISGIRIIVFYQDEIEKIASIIRDNFEIDEANSVDQITDHDTDELGYLFVRYAVSLSHQQKQIPEWRPFSDLKAEIQIGTVMQEAWATISPELIYKKEYEAPKQLQKKLSRLAVLLELVDEQFQEIRDLNNEIHDSLNDANSNINQDQLNLLTLENYLSKTDNITEQIATIGYESGFSSSLSNLDVSDMSSLILAASLKGIESISELEEVLTKSSQNISPIFKTMSNHFEDGWAAGKSLLNLFCLMNAMNDEELSAFKASTDWPDAVWDCIFSAITIQHSNLDP